MPPPSFASSLSRDWDQWVLSNGLPDLPERLNPHESVPIAYWTGPEFGAVMHIVDCDHDRDCEHDEHYATDERCFRRTPHGWEPASLSAGSDWPGGTSSRIRVPADYVEFDDYPGMVTDLEHGWRCVTVTGLIGRDAAWIELTQAAETTRRRMDAASGVFIVAMSGARPADLKILGPDGTIRATYTLPDAGSAESSVS
jgi:hypothetical protein